MKFDDLDRAMRQYELSLDQILAPDVYMVARLDGRGFTKLTKEICRFEAPFDPAFRDMMVGTVKELMNCGFRVVYGYTESDEISLLFHKNENAFGRKVRKYHSILSGVASAAFSLQLGQSAVFDCRMVPLPSEERVRDYFLWRQEDASRNALNSHCYWALRKGGATVQEATALLEGQTTAYKTQLLLRHGVNFDSLPSWQKRGIGLFWADVPKMGFNPVTGASVPTTRRELYTEFELPTRAEYAALVSGFLGDDSEGGCKDKNK